MVVNCVNHSPASMPAPPGPAADPAGGGGHSAPAYRRAVARAHGWHGYCPTPASAAASLAGLHAAADQVERPAGLGELEITVTPRGRKGPRACRSRRSASSSQSPGPRCTATLPAATSCWPSWSSTEAFLAGGLLRRSPAELDDHRPRSPAISTVGWYAAGTATPARSGRPCETQPRLPSVLPPPGSSKHRAGCPASSPPPSPLCVSPAGRALCGSQRVTVVCPPWKG
jgi:hypothetical protein